MKKRKRYDLMGSGCVRSLGALVALHTTCITLLYHKYANDNIISLVCRDETVETYFKFCPIVVCFKL